MVHGTSPLHHLKEVEFEVVRLRHIPEDRMVGGLLTGLDLAQLHAASSAAERSIFSNSSLGMKWLHEAVAK